MVETYLLSLGYQVLFIPKFHCEQNLIDHMWSQAKVTLVSLQTSL